MSIREMLRKKLEKKMGEIENLTIANTEELAEKRAELHEIEQELIEYERSLLC